MADYRIRVIIDPTQARRGANEVDRSLGRVNRSADRTRQLLTRAFAFVGVAEGIRRLAGISDAFTEITNRVRVASDEIGGANGSLDALFEIANRTRAPVSEMVRLFTRGALASKELGASQSELLVFTEAVGKGFAIQGSSAQKNADAILQLSQALGSSLVRGEEFNSILEGGFPIALAAARGIERFGGSVSRLREAVVAGRVTSQEFFRGILSQADELDALFQTTIPTIGQSLVILRNNLIEIVGAFNESSGTAETVSSSIIALANNIDRLIQLIKIAGIVILARFLRDARDAGVGLENRIRDSIRLQRIHAAQAAASAAAYDVETGAAHRATQAQQAYTASARTAAATAQERTTVYGRVVRETETYTVAQNMLTAAHVRAILPAQTYTTLLDALAGAQLRALLPAQTYTGILNALTVAQTRALAPAQAYAATTNALVAAQSRALIPAQAYTASQNLLTGSHVRALLPAQAYTSTLNASAGAHARASVSALAYAAGARAAGLASTFAAARTLALARAAAIAGGAWKLIGGPFGALALATFAVFEWTRANREARHELEALPSDIDAYRDSILALTAAQLDNRRITLVDSIADFERQRFELQERRRVLERQLAAPAGPFRHNLGDSNLTSDLIRVQSELDFLGQQIEVRVDQIRVGNEIRMAISAGFDPVQTDTVGDSAVDIDKLRTAYERLQSQIDPVAAAQRDFATSVQLLNDASTNGIINLETRDRLLVRLAGSYQDQLDPLQAVINALDEEIRLEGLSAEERRIQIQLLDQQRNLREAGVELDAAELRGLEDRIRTLDRLANAQEQINFGQADRNALISREIEVLNRQATITRLVGDEQAAATDLLGVEEAVRQKLREANRGLTEDQIDSLGRLTDAEALQITEASKLNQELTREAELYETIRGPLRTYQESVTALAGIYNQGRINAAEFDRELENLQITFLGNQQDIVSGVERGLLTIQSDFRDLASQSSDIVTSAFTTMEDRLVQFTQTGKIEFHSLVNSILADVARIVLRQQLIGPIANLFTSALSSVFTPTGTVSASSSVGRRGPSTTFPGGGGRAGGGLVFGPGTGRSDSILARLSNGEFVVNSASTRRNLPLLTAINSAPGFQDGGPVGGSRGRGRAMVEVQVIDQRRSGDEVEIQQQTGPGGTDQIQIYIRDAVDSNIASGRHDTALQGRFNLNSPLVPR